MQLTKKSFESNGKEIVVSIVTLDAGEGMFLPDVAKALGVDSSTIRTHVKNHNLIVENLNDQKLVGLKSLGLIHSRVVQINWLPKRTIQELVAIVGTPEAKAALRYLWDIAENPAVAAEHYKATGREAELLAEINQLKADNLKLVIENSSDGFLPEQVIAINGAVETVLRKHKVNPMTKWAYQDWTTRVLKESGSKGKVYFAIRARFLPTNSSLNWKEIERRHYEEVLEFVQNWVPTDKDMKSFRDHNALLSDLQDVKEQRAERDREASVKSEALLAERKARQAKAAAEALRPKRKYTKKVS